MSGNINNNQKIENQQSEQQTNAVDIEVIEKVQKQLEKTDFEAPELIKETKNALNLVKESLDKISNDDDKIEERIKQLGMYIDANASFIESIKNDITKHYQE
jgi:hypothetical protein